MTGTTANVGKIVAYMTGATANTPSNNPKSDSSKAAASFDNILNQVSDTVMQTKAADNSKDQKPSNMAEQIHAGKKNPVEKTDKAKEIEKKISETDKNSGDKGELKKIGDNTGKVRKEGNVDTGKEVKEGIEEAGEEIAGEITKLLDISEEEILNVMQMLGLTFADLFNPENLQQLVTTIGGQDTALDIITDSDIYTSLQDLMEGAESMKSELMNEFDLSEEDFEQVIKEPSFKEILDSKNVVEKPVEEDVLDPKTIVKHEVNANAATTEKEIKAPQSEGFKDVQVAEEEEKITVTTTEKSGSDTGKQNFHSESESANLFNQIVNNIAEAVNTEAPEAVTYTDRAQMENIVRQITEKITIAATEDKTTMELQLHPASLGNVNIMLTSSKEGIVAKFTAQNQIVKEAVESQMIQLQQKFDEAGIKVTSIEVTIASHAFEQNLQQQQGQNEAQENAKGNKKGLRRINLVDMGEDEEDNLSEAERIAAQMMAMNGNSIDFSA
ncbi:flagellar hook-length control protein FliK [Butyrivibrio sp. MC2021]|uniref:flagellar hook-length control protein FliK n=1 Tax=Butyrivibrio sp. MC2021 TaxID=1408306 RepID=UPI0004790272|nr:flagellar hook-length control protein FliK [Butyrivibrio sp. MC2021]